MHIPQTHFLIPMSGKKIGVIENEFGAVDIDGELLQDKNNIATEDEVVEMLNGCVCCTVRKDLQTTLVRMLKTEKRKLDAIIIETTGLADPAPVAQTFFVDPDLKGLCYLDAIITMVDAAHIDQQLSRDRPEGVENEAEEQLAFADKIILNKLDLVPDRAKLEATKKTLRKYNPLAEIIEATNADVAADKLMGIDSFNLKKVLDKDPDFLNLEKEEHEHDDKHKDEHHDEHAHHDEHGHDEKHEKHDHKHDDQVKSLVVQSEAPMSISHLKNWIDTLLSEYGEQVLTLLALLVQKFKYGHC